MPAPKPVIKSGITLASDKQIEQYSDALEQSSNDDFYRVYLDMKPLYGTSPAYFIDASRIANERDMKPLALRILSNIAELELENRKLLRVLGNRLLQIGYPDLAVRTLSEVLKISEEEPQSYRDLAIALATNGKEQESVDMFYSIAKRNWHGRFPEVEVIALTEMNNVIAHAKSTINTSAIDSNLIQNIPVGLRCVLNWDADNTDIDLWVTGPDSVKCFYGNRFTRTGGRLSCDFTGGYGPEDYMIRTPLLGKYRIQANYFGTRQQNLHGATTLYLDIYTDYGSPTEKKKTITLRLKTKEEVIEVGDVNIEE
jgi:hypothetical protein